MRIVRLAIKNFRAVEELVIVPRGNVVLVGEPGAGRTTCLEGIRRALLADLPRIRPPEPADFFSEETDRRIEVEVSLGDLGEDLEAELFDFLEVWDPEEMSIVEELDDVGLMDDDDGDLVVRLCYRGTWDGELAVGDHWVDFPKLSEPDEDNIRRVPARVRAMLQIGVSTDEDAFRLSATSGFRGLVEQMPGDDFVSALSEWGDTIEESARDTIGRSEQMDSAIDALIGPVEPLLNLPPGKASDSVTFLPDGGSLVGLLRSLEPTMIDSNVGSLTLWRHGSTAERTMRVAQAIAVVGSDPSVILFDDFGEGLDGAGATHLASVLRSADAQVWLSTRRPKVAGAFDADELVRLTIGDDGRRHVHQGEVPSTKSERLARRYEAQQLLPAIASRAVAVVEGPHDFAALSALSERLFRVRGLPKLAAHRIELMDSGLGAGGGDTRVPALGRAASEMGLFSIGVIDWDRDAEKATDRLTAAETGCDAVIRLPEGFAIERLLWEGVSEKAVRAGLKPLMKAFGAKSPRNGIDDLAGADLFKAMRRALKSSSGLHAQYIDALPLKALPPLAIELLELVVSVASSRTTGVHQLEAG